jgi:hypothetical protein
MKLLGTLPPQLVEKPYLHRIELLDRFFEMLDKKELVFVQPNCWSDPLENIIFNATFRKNGEPFDHPVKKSMFAQCWSYDEDSYALWQIYTTKANDKGITSRYPGVRITTHLDRLPMLSQWNTGALYYGVVNYLTLKELKLLPSNQEFVSGLKKMQVNADHLKTLLVKRKSYQYEKEVRLFAVPPKPVSKNAEPQLCRLRMEPNLFISSIRLDPTLTTSEYRKIKTLLEDKYGFVSTRISQSSLNRSNSFAFEL